MKLWLKQLRWHQWAKNLLLVVPTFASFKLFSMQNSIGLSLILAFVSFCLTASSIYIFNDFLDLANDRSHSIKKNRPMASGAIKPFEGLTVAIVFMIGGLIQAYVVGFTFLVSVVVYIAFTVVYSLWLKRVTLVDTIILAGLYTLRVVAGGLATGIELSFWLLAFSIFFFLSLAWVKRYAELDALKRTGASLVPGRGYLTSDLPLVLNFGSASGVIAVLIFALYLDSSAIRTQYSIPEIGWLAIPFLIYLIGRMWFKAFRGEMNQDPMLFLFRDWASIVTVILMGSSLVVAHLGFVS